MKGQARREFDAWASSYDRSLLNHFMFRPSYEVFMEEIARWYGENPRPFRVLDVGCGTGSLASLLTASPWPVTPVGMDYSASMCVEASGKSQPADAGRDARFIAGDSEHLPFADGAFDIVACSNSFHHYPHQQAVVREMRRVLSPGGRLILIDGFRDNVIGWFVFDVCIAAVEKEVHHAPWSTIHQHFLAAGFRNVRRRKFNLWFPLLATIGDA
jgi:ubiquinone/menaquinone biosynthesis C-methylase UbiE